MPNKLSAYHAKRDFKLTREPRGSVKSGADELRFVVQKHDASRLHYDFRLELDGVLKSWAIPKGPSLDPGEKRLAVHVEDHPLDYADFEGVIPEHQYGAGTVEIWDSGIWEASGDAARDYRAGKLKFRLYGEKLQGEWALVRTRLPGSKDKEHWLLIKMDDDAARPAGNHAAPEQTDISSPSKKTSARKSSAAEKPASSTPMRKAKAKRAKKPGVQSKSGSLSPQSLPHAVKAALPASVPAQLATLVDSVPTEGEWEYEIKFDGYRLLACIDKGNVRMFTRDGKEWTSKLPKQVAALQELDIENAWMDGEIVVLDEKGIPSFQQLQNAFDKKSTADIVFFAFDLMHLNGYDLRKSPLRERRRLLEKVFAAATDGPVRYSSTLNQPPEKLLESACSLSMEGIIGKLSDSPYTGRRSSEWIKLKCRKRQEFVIAGYTEPQGSRQHFGSLLLAVYGDDGLLYYTGRVGTGFDKATLQATYKLLKPLTQSKCPFPQVPKSPGTRHAHWLKPKLVAEISFAEWTKEGLLRQAVFHGLRLDKPPEQIRREEALKLEAEKKTMPKRTSSSEKKKSSLLKQPGRAQKSGTAGDVFHGVTITHPDRIIDPSTGLTKLDLARYYDAVAPYILPYLKNRPVYLLRSPGGLQGKSFFQRHALRTSIPGIKVLDPSVDPEHEPLMVIDTPKALVGAAQMGSFELHSCSARADMIDRPDYLVFDLDPDPALSWKSIAEGARIAKTLLDELGLKCFLKTSGSKGLHVVVPLARRHPWGMLTAFTKAVAVHLAKTFPNRFSASMGEQNRVGEIFIDYLRNQKMASTVTAYSARAKNGLSVSTPIAWDELESISGSGMWTITSIPERLAKLKKDPWDSFFSTRQMLTKSMIETLA